MTLGDFTSVVIFVALLLALAASVWAYNKTENMEKRGHAFLVGLVVFLALIFSVDNLQRREWGEADQLSDEEIQRIIREAGAEDEPIDVEKIIRDALR